MTRQEFRIQAALLALQSSLSTETDDYNFSNGAKKENAKRKARGELENATPESCAAEDSCDYADALTAEAEKRGYFAESSK